jgi:hypothetical protein
VGDVAGEVLEEFEDVARVVGTYLGVHDLEQWNFRKVAGGPISADDAAVVAHLVLKRRLREIRKPLPLNAPLRMNVISGYERCYRHLPSLLHNTSTALGVVSSAGARSAATSSAILPSESVIRVGRKYRSRLARTGMAGW